MFSIVRELCHSSQLEQSDLCCGVGFCNWGFCIAWEDLTFYSFTCNAIFPSHSRSHTPPCWGMAGTINLSTFIDHRGLWHSIHRVLIRRWFPSVTLRKKSSRGHLPELLLHPLMRDEAAEAAEENWENCTSALGVISLPSKSHWVTASGVLPSTPLEVLRQVPEGASMPEDLSKAIQNVCRRGIRNRRVIPCKHGCVIALVLGMKEDNRPWGLCTILTQPVQHI